MSIMTADKSATIVDTSVLDTIGDELGDEILSNMATDYRVGTVTDIRGRVGDVRGWTFGGNVD